MRRLAVLLMFLLFCMPVAAQGGPTAEDGSGDVASDNGAPSPGPMSEVDLKSLHIVELPQELHFIVEVADLEDESEATVLAAAVEIDFSHHGQPYRIYMGRNNVFGGGEYWGQLSAVDPATGRESRIDNPPVEIDTDAETLMVAIAREFLRDPDGAPPFPGRSIDDIVVLGAANRMTRGQIDIAGQPVPDARFTDRMPNKDSASFDIQLGVQQDGPVMLGSEEPFRASNGEATTYVFQVRASNEGSDTRSFEFVATDVPANWDVSVPEGSVEIGANRALSFPIVVSTAFAHNHGATESFILEMQDTQDSGTTGRVELGVHYPTIPQPAGHHDTVWIHSVQEEDDLFTTVLGTALGANGVGIDAYFNALEDDERADEVPIPGYRCGADLRGDTPTPVMRYCWSLPLDPALQLGLDFDLDRTGILDLAFSSDVPMQGTTIEAAVMYRAPSEDWTPQQGPSQNNPWMVLASANHTDGKDVATNTGFEMVVHPHEAGDFIPYVAGASLRLEITATALRPDNPLFGPGTPGPTLRPGGFMQLPLNEYADPVEDIVQIVAKGLRFEAMTDQERPVNAGETVMFRALLRSSNATEVDLNIIGSGREWAQLITPPTLTVDGATEVNVAVTAPSDASVGEMADLVIEASNVDAIEDKALIRFVATVTEEDVPDEASVAETLAGVSDKESPGLALVALLGGLAIVARRK